MQVAPSATMDELGNGVIRGSTEGRGEPHLLPLEAIKFVLQDYFGGFTSWPWFALIELSKLYAAGAKKYPPRNWEKGMPLHRFVDSAIRHFRLRAICDTSEPHIVQVSWNLIGLYQTHIWIEQGVLSRFLADGLPNVKFIRSGHTPKEDLPEELGEDTIDGYLAEAYFELTNYVAGHGLNHLARACACAFAAVNLTDTSLGAL